LTPAEIKTTFKIN